MAFKQGQLVRKVSNADTLCSDDPAEKGRRPSGWVYSPNTVLIVVDPNSDTCLLSDGWYTKNEDLRLVNILDLCVTKFKKVHWAKDVISKLENDTCQNMLNFGYLDIIKRLGCPS